MPIHQIRSSSTLKLASSTSRLVSPTASPRVAARMFSHTGPKSKEPTFSNQDKLPRLPIPDLGKALEGYLKSLIPVIEHKYGAENVKKELEKRKLYAKDFVAPGGIGQALHERLKGGC